MVRPRLIEHYGIYYHKTHPRNYRETEQGRIEYFRQFGYETLVIWQPELKEPDKVLAKVAEFVNSH